MLAETFQREGKSLRCQEWRFAVHVLTTWLGERGCEVPKKVQRERWSNQEAGLRTRHVADFSKGVVKISVSEGIGTCGGY